MPDSLSPENAKPLDLAFVAVVRQDLEALQATLIRTSLRPAWYPYDYTKFCEAVRIDADLSNTRTVGNRLAPSAQGMPTGVTARRKFMTSVYRVMSEYYEGVGLTLSHNYERFVIPPTTIDEVDSADTGDKERLEAGLASTDWHSYASSERSDYQSFDEFQFTRPGTWIADQENPQHTDYWHTYTHFWRQDLLDYGSGDFYSIRRLSGINSSIERTRGLPYRESSERSFQFADASVRAFDVRTQEPLTVVPALGWRTPASTHFFRILWLDGELKPGDPFDVVYAIRCPGELEALKRERESMSVSFARIVNPIGHLTFNVVLNVVPYSAEALYVQPERSNRHGQDWSPELMLPCTGKSPRVERYEPSEWFESPEFLGIEWSEGSDLHIIRWSTERPYGRTYLIQFSADFAS